MNGVEINIRDEQGRTPLDLAVINNLDDMIALLRDSGGGTLGANSPDTETVRIADVNQTDILVDERDGQQYGIVAIGSQIWMGENLNYESEGSGCYEENEKNCAEFGRLYTYVSAQRSCPEEWHLPSDAEWAQLEKSFGIDRSSNLYGYAGDVRLSDISSNGLARFAGISDKGTFGGIEKQSIYWTSTTAYGLVFRLFASNKRGIYRNDNLLSGAAGISVRCVRD